ncbi:ABC transporter permease [Paenibacillus lautus]|nr:ABC transporter permease [Paenibacillus lautus]MBU5349602.1 ABC transporter permease [Paenibacillus lautus]
MAKLIRLEWRKLNPVMVISELLVYMLILIFLPAFFIKIVMPAMGQSYEAFIELNGYIQMGYVLFGASLINHVFIEEYKKKTMSLSFGYPYSRQTLFTAKISFIALFVFAATVISFLLSGVTTLLLDNMFSLIPGQPTASDIQAFISSMLIRSVLITLISFVPLFLFGVWKRAVVPAIMCSMVAMQIPNLSMLLKLNPDIVIIVLSVLGGLSILLAIKMADRAGEV